MISTLECLPEPAQITKHFAFERFSYKESNWHRYSWESDLVSNHRPLIEEFKKNSNHFDVATKVLAALHQESPAERFRMVHETITIQVTAYQVAEPSKVLTVDDLQKIADKPPHHDGVRIFNTLVPVIREVNLDPNHFGSYDPRLVKFAIKHKDNPPNKWIIPHHEYEPWNCHREWVNLALGVSIILDSQIGGFGFTRKDYRDGGKAATYQTFAAAVECDEKLRGCQKIKRDKNESHRSVTIEDVKWYMPKDATELHYEQRTIMDVVER